eukprot:754731-Hanusia_phi.AAC.7
MRPGRRLLGVTTSSAVTWNGVLTCDMKRSSCDSRRQSECLNDAGFIVHLDSGKVALSVSTSVSHTFFCLLPSSSVTSMLYSDLCCLSHCKQSSHA